VPGYPKPDIRDSVFKYQHGW